MRVPAATKGKKVKKGPGIAGGSRAEFSINVNSQNFIPKATDANVRMGSEKKLLELRYEQGSPRGSGKKSSLELLSRTKRFCHQTGKTGLMELLEMPDKYLLVGREQEAGICS